MMNLFSNKLTMIFKLITYLLSFTLLSVSYINASELSTHYLGQAYDLESNELVYTEEYKEFSQDGRPYKATVTYFSPRGETIAEKSITFNQSLATPNFIMVDHRSGYTEKVEQAGQKFKVSLQTDKNAPRTNTTLSPALPAVVDAGFHYFILTHWETLLTGKQLTFNFVVPSSQDYFKFEIQKKDDSENLLPHQVQFKTEVSSFLLKVLVDPIVTTYDRRSRRLLEYQGLSNVNDANGKSHDVRIQMMYQDLSMSFGQR